MPWMLVTFHLQSIRNVWCSYIYRTTLKDQLNYGRVVHETKPDSKPYLRHSEERELADHLKKLSDMGMRKTRREVLCIADVDKRMLRTNSGGWWRQLLEHNPSMSLRARDAAAGVRMDAINQLISKEDTARKHK